MDALTTSLTNAGGLGALAAALFWLHTNSIAAFREELKTERRLFRDALRAIGIVMPIDRWPASWRLHARAAGPILNQQMACAADAAAVFYGPGPCRGSAAGRGPAAIVAASGSQDRRRQALCCAGTHRRCGQLRYPRGKIIDVYGEVWAWVNREHYWRIPRQSA